MMLPHVANIEEKPIFYKDLFIFNI